MAKHFISILGTGGYKNIMYCSEEGKYKTMFVQEAILKLKFSEWNEQDRITVFLTEDSKKINWLDRPYNDREKATADAENSILPEYKTGLETILKKDFAEYLYSGNDNIIPIGANEEELWKIFQNIVDCLREEDELYIDITHALRNIPIQMLAVSAYARAVKNVQIKAIYYGAYEVGKENEEGIVEAPIFDLITFLDVLDWSQAAQSFVRYGNSEQIKELFQSQKKQMNVRMPDLQNVVCEIDKVTRGLEASRGCFDYQNASNNKSGKSILGSYRKYKESYQTMMQKDEKEEDESKRQLSSIKPLSGLMELVDKKLSVFDVNNNLELGIAAIKWSIDNNKIQQGFTALEETIKTFLCNHFGLDETLKEHRDGICKRACNLLAYDLSTNKLLTPQVREMVYSKQLQEAFPDKSEKELQMNVQAELEMLHIGRVLREVPQEMVALTRDISSNRNSMNHFGYSSIGQFSSSLLEENLKKYYQRFMECMDSMNQKNKQEHQ